MLCSFAAGAQNVEYRPLPNDATADKALVTAVTKRFEKDVAALPPPNKKATAEIYRERFDLIVKRFQEGEVITNATTQAYFSRIVREVFRGNPNLDTTGLRIYFSRASDANASSLGEGTILFNIGLFHRLKNEAQAAFVVSHELAHYFLNHGNNDIQSHVNTIYSNEFQKKLKDIQKSGYRQNSQVEALTKNLLFKNRRHSRAFEQSADSMAVELMKNTRFDVREALTSLALLDSADKEKYNAPLRLETVFHFPSYPFKQAWIKSNMLVIKDSASKREKAEADSLKTHPDCKLRIERLSTPVAQYAKAGSVKFVGAEEEFAALQKQFDREMIEHAFQSKGVSLALYLALKMRTVYPGDLYANATIGRCLNEIYSYQKRHELSRIVDLPGPGVAEEYNSLLHLIQNTRLQEIAALSYHFLKQYETQLSTHPLYAPILAKSAEHFNQ
ncbi:MAG TPA: M48 family metalloprotease [Flavisolibacter sp.]|nr:M48 family metalloprotease [Flavisolibacter sp.]